jgi:hypothetical protein
MAPLFARGRVGPGKLARTNGRLAEARLRKSRARLRADKTMRPTLSLGADLATHAHKRTGPQVVVARALAKSTSALGSHSAPTGY